jgi:hypothetical protein
MDEGREKLQVSGFSGGFGWQAQRLPGDPICPAGNLGKITMRDLWGVRFFKVRRIRRSRVKAVDQTLRVRWVIDEAGGYSRCPSHSASRPFFPIEKK